MKLSGSDFVDEYLKWLKNSISINEIDGCTQISTPFLDRHNDHIQIYVEQHENGIVLSDGGETIGDLELCGCELSSPKRRTLLESFVKGYGIRCEDGELFVETTACDFPQKKHALIQTIMSVSDMFMLSHNRVVSLFCDDVRGFFDEHKIAYTQSVMLPGKSAYPHNFDFILPKSENHSERVIRTFNTKLDREKTETTIFAWQDTVEARRAESKMIVLLNDKDEKVNKIEQSTTATAFSRYGIQLVLWSQMKQKINLFK